MKVDYIKVAEMYEQGLGITKIAKTFAVSTQAIHKGFKVKNIAKQIKPLPKIPCQERLIYYAGFFDGEGHITWLQFLKTNRNQVTGFKLELQTHS
jgi:hypothetical protein